MNNLMFKMTSWGLLALVWAWLSFEWLPNYAANVQHPCILVWLGDNPPAEPMPEPGELNPIVKLAAESPRYTFLAGVLVVAWCYLLETNIRSPVTGAAASGAR
jgi:hypothetical protein